MPLHTRVILYDTDSVPAQCMSGSTDIEIVDAVRDAMVTDSTISTVDGDLTSLWQGAQMADMWVNDGDRVEYAPVLCKTTSTGSTLLRPHNPRGEHVLRDVFGCPRGSSVELCDLGHWTNMSREGAQTETATLRVREAMSHV